jgi:hypothetical protein
VVLQRCDYTQTQHREDGLTARMGPIGVEEGQKLTHSIQKVETQYQTLTLTFKP